MEHSREEDIRRLGSLIKDIKFCMLTTVDTEGHLHSRPMAVQEMEFDGDLWFFTGKSTMKAQEIKFDSHVNVSFAKPEDNKYVSVSGRARLVDDPAKAKQLWNPMYKAWFPEGLDDPDLALMKVEVTRGEYWDAPNGAVTYLWGLAKAMVSGQRADPGEHEKVDLTGERR
jgi:general stress protein 26